MASSPQAGAFIGGAKPFPMIYYTQRDEKRSTQRRLVGVQKDDGMREDNFSAEDSKVRIMARAESSSYSGETIEEDGSSDKAQQEQRTGCGAFHRHTVYNGNGWLAKLSLFFIIAAIIAFVVFAVLPVALIGLVVGAAIWLVFSWLR